MLLAIVVDKARRKPAASLSGVERMIKRCFSSIERVNLSSYDSFA